MRALGGEELGHFAAELRPLLSARLDHLARESPTLAPGVAGASAACTRAHGRRDVYTGACQCRTGWGGATCDEALAQAREQTY